MAERRTRRRFTAEFKTQAVERLLEGGKLLSGPAPSEWRGGIRTHAALSMATPSMLALTSAGGSVALAGCGRAPAHRLPVRRRGRRPGGRRPAAPAGRSPARHTPV